MYDLSSIAAEVLAPQGKQGLHNETNESCVIMLRVSTCKDITK